MRQISEPMEYDHDDLTDDHSNTEMFSLVKKLQIQNGCEYVPNTPLMKLL